MKVLREGHRYELENFENKEIPGQVIQFIEKAPNEAGEFVTVFDGTTNEEVLGMLLNRMNNLNAKFPCKENSIAIAKMGEALMWLIRRTNNRVARGVEGKHVK